MMRKLALSILILPSVYFYLHAQTRETRIGTATISGYVTPARSAIVVLRSDEEWGEVSRVKADEKGQFHFTGLKAGRYRLAAGAPGFSPPVEYSFNSRATTINISDGEEIEDIEINLNRGSVITGRVTNANGKPLVEQIVEVFKLDDSGKPTGPGLLGSYKSMTDDRGIYRQYGLESGRYMVSAGAPREASIMPITNRTYYQRTFYPDTTDESKAKLVKVNEGSETTGIDIKVSGPKKTYMVSGHVEYADTSQIVSGVEMSFGTLANDGKNVNIFGYSGNHTDAQGEFHLQGVLPGKYVVSIRNSAGSDYYVEPAQVEVSDADITGLIVKLRRGSSISGVVSIGGANDPDILSQLSQISIGAFVISQELVEPVLPTKVSSDGTFILNGLRPGIAKLSINSSQQFSILSIARNGTPQSEGIQINSGEQVTGVGVVIGVGTNNIRGQVHIINGALPQGCTLFVSAKRAETHITNGRGGAVDPISGRFMIMGLTPGDYELKPSLLFYAGYSESTGLDELLNKLKQAVTINDAQETEVTFVVDLNSKGGGQ